MAVGPWAGSDVGLEDDEAPGGERLGSGSGSHPCLLY